jgi:uncharacterized membrane protein
MIKKVAYKWRMVELLVGLVLAVVATGSID